MIITSRTNMIIRDATDGDIPLIEKAFAETYNNMPIDSDFFGNMVKDQSNINRVVDAEGDIIGFMTAEPFEGSNSVARTDMFIVPRYHRRGIGGLLFNDMRETLGSNDYEFHCFYIDPTNKASIESHAKWGVGEPIKKMKDKWLYKIKTKKR